MIILETERKIEEENEHEDEGNRMQPFIRCLLGLPLASETVLQAEEGWIQVC